MKKVLLSLLLLISIAGFSQATKNMRGYTPRSAQLSDTLFTNQGTTGTTTFQLLKGLYFPGTTLQYMRGDGSQATFPTNNTAFSNGAGYLLPADVAGKADKTTTLTINGTTFDLSANRSWTIAGGGSSTTLTDNLTTSTTGTALDAHQGFVLKGLIDGNTTAISGKQNAITLTTTGASGAATLTGNTLNIPQYSGSGASTATLKNVTTNGYQTSVFTKWGDTSFRKAADSAWFFGDSYTGGAGASPTSMRFATLTAAMMSSVEINKGIAGTTLQLHTVGDSSMIDRLYTLPFKTPTRKALFFEYGTNDANQSAWADTASFRVAYYRIIDTAVARGWSLNDLVIIPPGYYGGALDQSRRLQYISVAMSIGVAKGVAVADAWGLLQSESPNTAAYMSSDSLHPNNYGHLLFSRAILNAYKGKHQSELSVHGKINTNYLNLTNDANGINPSVLNIYDTSSSNGSKSLAFELRQLSVSSSLGAGLGSLSVNSTGQFNSAFGKNTLAANTTGSYNNAFGLNALSTNTTGSRNTSFGTQALQSNTTSSSNTAFGAQALTFTTGGSNTAVGDVSLTANTTGNSNVAVGADGLKANTTGGQNTAVGFQTLTANTTGTLNTAIGDEALKANTTNGQSVGVGWRALFTANAQQNTAIGSRSGESLTSGTNNLFAGFSAGFTNTTGSNNIFIGSNAGNSATYATVSNRLVIGNNITLPLLDGTMGTTAAAQSLTINGKLLFPATITTTGTTGAQTINNPSGTVNIAAAGTSVTVTNSLITTSSIVYCVIRTNDANNVAIKSVVPAAGSFTVNLTTAPAAEISIGFIVYN